MITSVYEKTQKNNLKSDFTLYRFLLYLSFFLLLVAVGLISTCFLISEYCWFAVFGLILICILIRYFADNIIKEFEYTINKDKFAVRKITIGNGAKKIIEINLNDMVSLAKIDDFMINLNRKNNNYIICTKTLENAYSLSFNDGNKKAIIFCPDKFMVSLIQKNYEKIKEGKLL